MRSPIPVTLIGTNLDNQTLSEPVTVINDTDGTQRLAVSYGIPKQGQVSSFRTVNYSLVANSTVVYTCPAGKTFYVLGMQFSNNSSSSPSGLTILVGQQTLTLTIALAGNVVIANQFPVAIVQQGETITIVSNGSPATSQGNIYGYEEFGVTT